MFCVSNIIPRNIRGTQDTTHLISQVFLAHVSHCGLCIIRLHRSLHFFLGESLHIFTDRLKQHDCLVILFVKIDERKVSNRASAKGHYLVASQMCNERSLVSFAMVGQASIIFVTYLLKSFNLDYIRASLPQPEKCRS